MLTKKDFKELASIVVELRHTMHKKVDSWAIEFIATDLENKLADFCAAQNPAFNRAKFLAACKSKC